MARDFEAEFEAGGANVHSVIRFRETHALGVPTEMDVDVLLSEYADIDTLVGQAAALSYGFGEDPKHAFVGVVESVTVIGSALVDAGRTHQYVFHVVSHLALLARSFGCEIHQELDVKGIVSKVLKDHGITSDGVEWRLTETYVKREYCVQYQESALDFVTRLLEEEGIYFFSEIKDGRELLVFADDSTAAKPIEGDESIPYRARSGMHDALDAIFAIGERHRVVSGAFVLRDFNFEKPKLDLTSTAKSDVHTDLEIYDYPGGYFEAAEGKRRAKVRLEAEQANRRTVVVQADSARFQAGRKIKIIDAPEADGEYLVVSTVTEFVEGGEGEHAQADDFSVTAELLPVSLKYRLRTLTPRPVIDGPQTAEIVAPKGSQAEEIHTDKHGRCKVKFHWDLAPGADDKSSCWMRVSQLQTSGSMVLPRVSWEFIVEFLEGDPDRPIVTGRVYNGVFMPPYALPEGKTRTSMQTLSTPGGTGRNEIRLEDKAGGEEIMMQSQYDTNIVVANNKTKNVGNNETSTVGVDSKLEVGANQDVKITKGSQNSIGANQTVSVGGNRSVEVNAVTGLTVGGAATTKVGGNQMSMVGNPLEALLALAAEKAAEFAAAKAGEALAKIDGAVQGKVDQVMGPINDVTAKANALGDGMKAVANGDLSASGGLMAGAAGIGGAGALAGAMGGNAGSGPSGGLAATTTAAPGGSSAAGISATNLLGGMAQTAIQKGIGKAKGGIGKALGLGGDGGGGSSEANAAGPEGAVDGVDATDREKGPGHNMYKVVATHTEKVAALKVTAALNGIMTNVTGAMTQTVGAAHVELVIGDYAESVEGDKSEMALGLVVLSKGDETEKVSGAKKTMVGGAILEKVAGGYSVTAGGPAMFVGAFHKLEAATSITLKCGGSELVIDASGITIKATLVSILAPKITLSEDVSEVA